MTPVRENLEAVERRLQASCERAGRPRESVTLVAVSKSHPPESVLEAHALGVRHFGENRVQEARGKIPALPGNIEWHFIGRLQTNKAKYLPGLVHWIHSVDRPEVVEALERACANRGGRLRCLIEVNVAGESQKGGAAPGDAGALVRLAGAQPHLAVEGLMTMAPFDEDPRRARPVFRALRELAETIRAETGLPLPHLSMGMTQDFETAVEEGATIVRIGTAIFGERTQG